MTLAYRPTVYETGTEAFCFMNSWRFLQKFRAEKLNGFIILYIPNNMNVSIYSVDSTVLLFECFECRKIKSYNLKVSEENFYTDR